MRQRAAEEPARGSVAALQERGGSQKFREGLDRGGAAIEYVHRTWRHENGLPDNRVRAILQTKDGYIWVATQDGLARFDGRRFTVFKSANTPAMRGDDCVSLAEDINGVLWIGTHAGVLRERRGEFTRVAGPEQIQCALMLRASRLGGIWGGNDRMVCRIFRGSVRCYYPDPSIQPVVAIDEDDSGMLWIGCRGGLFRLDPKSQSFKRAPRDAAIGHLPVMSFWDDDRGKRWMLFGDGTRHRGVSSYPGWLACRKNATWIRRPDEAKPDVRVDQRTGFVTRDPFGNVWLPSQAAGLYRFAKGRFQLFSMPHLGAVDYPLCAYPDREGNLWVGTESSGLQRWTPRRAMGYTTRDGLASDNAWSICQSRDGSVWIGTDKGLSRFQNGRFVDYPLNIAPRPQVHAVVEDREGTLWAGTMDGLISLRNGKLSMHRLPGKWFESKIRVLLPARDGALWIGTVRGLTRLFHGRSKKYTPADGLGSQEVRALLEDKDGDLWVGTEGGGLSCLHDGKFTTLTTTNGLSNNNVWALYQDQQGVLWIGTEGGLDRLENGRLTAFTVRQGLPANAVNCILEDNSGRLWISYDHGIYWVWKRQLNAVAEGRAVSVQAVRYDRADGLLTTETNGRESNPVGCKTRDGRLWFPTTKGVVVIDPRLAIVDDVAPRTVVEQMRSNGRVVFGNSPADRAAGDAALITRLHGRRYKLPPGGARVLEFHYTANTFVAAESARFRYRLLGLDPHWIDAGSRRMAEFYDLSPGDYEFEVIACNHHGVWATHGATVAFRVTPFIYQTWWFYLVCGLFVAGAAAGTVRWRLQEVRKIQRLERLNALAEQRQRIARDIHDELGSSLTRILRLNEETRRNLGQPEEALNQTERIASLAEEAVNHIGEIVWANNPKYDTLGDLVAYLREYAAEYMEATGVEVKFDFPEKVPDRAVSGLFRRHLLLVLKEALHNVVKHAGAHRLRVWLVLRDGRLELGLEDDGRGIQCGNEPGRGNGLGYMRERVAELKGSLTMISDPGRGTTISVAIPLPAP